MSKKEATMKVVSPKGIMHEVSESKGNRLKSKCGFKNYVEPKIITPLALEELIAKLEAKATVDAELIAKLEAKATVDAESKPVEHPLNAVKTANLVGKLDLEELVVFESDERQTVITAIEKRKEALKK